MGCFPLSSDGKEWLLSYYQGWLPSPVSRACPQSRSKMADEGEIDGLKTGLKVFIN